MAKRKKKQHMTNTKWKRWRNWTNTPQRRHVLIKKIVFLVKVKKVYIYIVLFLFLIFQHWIFFLKIYYWYLSLLPRTHMMTSIEIWSQTSPVHTLYSNRRQKNAGSMHTPPTLSITYAGVSKGFLYIVTVMWIWFDSSLN